MNPKLKFYKFI